MTAWGTAVFKNLLSSNEAENLHESIINKGPINKQVVKQQ